MPPLMGKRDIEAESGSGEKNKTAQLIKTFYDYTNIPLRPQSMGKPLGSLQRPQGGETTHFENH